MRLSCDPELRLGKGKARKTAGLLSEAFNSSQSLVSESRWIQLELQITKLFHLQELVGPVHQTEKNLCPSTGWSSDGCLHCRHLCRVL